MSQLWQECSSGEAKKGSQLGSQDVNQRLYTLPVQVIVRREFAVGRFRVGALNTNKLTVLHQQLESQPVIRDRSHRTLLDFVAPGPLRPPPQLSKAETRHRRRQCGHDILAE
ncbi:hypothetical protein NQZ68_023136 [Dissostichus eleginoides]|nr:hypothetical protein NQZ68_023136 [Dissostichus eleginoides]